MLRQMTGQKKVLSLTETKEKSPVPKNKICVISITSGKGGVGKTNITANLAYLLAGMKKKTLILDADCGLANIDLILGLTPKYNLYNVLTGERTLKETIVSGPGESRFFLPHRAFRKCPVCQSNKNSSFRRN